MHVFSVTSEAEFNPKKHVEKILGTIEDGDVTVACWEPGQISPNHCHPHATEIYFCFEGGGTMRTPEANHRGGARRLRGASARRSARIRERPATHAAVPRALRFRHALAPRHLARPPRLDAKRRRRRLLQDKSGPRLTRGGSPFSSCAGLTRASMLTHRAG